jgi:1-deoxy-D-xylulose-5-phosphate synthase
VTSGGFGSAVLEFAARNYFANIKKRKGIPNVFIEHGTIDELQQYCNIDVKSLEVIFQIR